MNARRHAHYLVMLAVRSGALVRQPCEVCGAMRIGDRPIDAHHRFGYGRPLDVAWLCRRHHLQEHGSPLGETYQRVVAFVRSGVSQSEIARRLHVSRQRVHQIVYRSENGRHYSDRAA